MRSAASRARPSRHGARAFTLVELLVVMAIAAILLAIGIPNMAGYVATNRVATAGNDLMTALQLARSEAIRLGVPVGVRTRAAGGSGDFGSAGWELVADTNRDGAISAADGPPIRAGGAVTAPLTVYGTPAVFGSTVVFDATGRSVNGGGTLVACYGGVLADGGQPRSRALAVAASGRVRFAQHDASGVPLNDAGAALTSCTNP